MDELQVQKAKSVLDWTFLERETLNHHIICLGSLLLSKMMKSLTEQEREWSNNLIQNAAKTDLVLQCVWEEHYTELKGEICLRVFFDVLKLTLVICF